MSIQLLDVHTYVGRQEGSVGVSTNHVQGAQHRGGTTRLYFPGHKKSPHGENLQGVSMSFLLLEFWANTSLKHGP